MNRKELIAALSEKTGCTKAEANRHLAAVLEIIVLSLQDGFVVYIDQLGTFKAEVRSARRIRHPRTGEIMKIPTALRPKFAPSSKFKNAIKD